MDRTQPMDRHVENMMTIHELTSAPPAAQMFGNAGIEHMNLYGETWTNILTYPESCEYNMSKSCLEMQISSNRHKIYAFKKNMIFDDAI